jgi:transglutaminase-like putative cysteine protease
MKKFQSTVIAIALGSTVVSAGTPPSRHLTLTYTCYLTHLPATTRQVDCWIPVPTSNDRQTVEVLAADQDHGRFTTEAKYGNKMYYRHFVLDKDNPGDTVKITLVYKITLDEKSVPEAKQLSLASEPVAAQPAPNAMGVYLTAARLIPLQGPIEALGEKLSLSDQPIRAARQIYDYLIANMVYNYQAPGAGHGDAVWACNSRTGDCTDYHSIFIGVCRASGIPADHVFGIPLRAQEGRGTAAYWHCWARFWAGQPGWITIDASEAAKHPELREYNFGTLSNTYLTLSHGRDVMLEPAQKGPLLNIFADPYVEADGAAFPDVKWVVNFQEDK